MIASLSLHITILYMCQANLLKPYLASNDAQLQMNAFHAHASPIRAIVVVGAVLFALLDLLQELLFVGVHGLQQALGLGSRHLLGFAILALLLRIALIALVFFVLLLILLLILPFLLLLILLLLRLLLILLLLILVLVLVLLLLLLNLALNQLIIVTSELVVVVELEGILECLQCDFERVSSCSLSLGLGTRCLGLARHSRR